jgi:protein TonB
MKSLLLLLIVVPLLLAQWTPPRLIHRVEPKYSDAARDAKVSGTVRLAITIDESGFPTDVRVTQSVGYGLDQMATDAVSQWRFEPATKNGKPVALKATVELNFRLTTSPAP